MFVDGEDQGVVRSDGVIVSTPLGSRRMPCPPTAAGASQGAGPHPDAHFALLQELPAHRPARRTPGIRLETDAAAPDAFLTVDGQEGIPLCGGDVIRVQSLDAGLRVLSCSSGTYFQRLRERGFIQTDGTSAPEHV